MLKLWLFHKIYKKLFVDKLLVGVVGLIMVNIDRKIEKNIIKSIIPKHNVIKVFL